MNHGDGNQQEVQNFVEPDQSVFIIIDFEFNFNFKLIKIRFR